MLIALGGVGGCGSDSGEVIARVGASQITAGSVAHWAYLGETVAAPMTQALFHDTPERLTWKQRALRFLISSAQTVREAHERGIQVSNAAAATALELLQLQEQQGLPILKPGLERLVSVKAETHADRVSLVRLHMISEQLQKLELSEAEEGLSRAQLANYYAAHKRDFALPERRDVAVIETFQKADSDAAKREIDSGKSLLGVVNRRDDEPGVGGIKRGLSRRGLRHGYENNYFTAPAHVLVGPLKEEIYYLFEVTAIFPPRQQAFAEVQKKIRMMMIAHTRSVVLKLAEQALERKWRPRTLCRAAYVVQQCGGRLT